MDMFILFLCIFLILEGVSKFIGDRVVLVLAGIAGIVAAIIGFTRL